jgi:protein-S-isoprenylcysteine O-methyltransferase Ste14
MSGTSSPANTTVRRTLVRLWGAVAAAVLVLTAVVLVTSDADSTVPAALPVTLTAAVAVGAAAGVAAVDRNLADHPPADDAAAVQELRTRTFLQLAILEAPVLLGVALGFTLGPPWVAVIGAAGALGALVLARPTRARLGRLDAAWRDAGRDVSVLRGLGEGAAG